MSEKPQIQSKQEVSKNTQTTSEGLQQKESKKIFDRALKLVNEAGSMPSKQYAKFKESRLTPQQKDQQKLEEAKINMKVMNALKSLDLPKEIADIVKTVMISSLIAGLSGQFNPKDAANVPQNVGKETEQLVKKMELDKKYGLPKETAKYIGQATQGAAEVFSHKPFQAGHLAKEAINNATQATMTPPTSVK